jgi:CCR4-NOT transcription complex subunit 7/8
MQLLHQQRHTATTYSGYDFGYLLKVLTSSALPGQEKEFFTLLKTYFPKLYDIKYLMANQDGFHGGLNKLGDDLGVRHLSLANLLLYCTIHKHCAQYSAQHCAQQCVQ